MSASGRLAIILVAMGIAQALAAQTFADDRTLTAACDELLATAIRRPYGIAWGKEPQKDDPARPELRQVSLEPMYTPSAGLMLFMAGEQLHQPRFTEAAKQVARTLSAAQEPTGRIPAAVSFGPRPSGHDAPRLVSERGPTRAGLALLLIMLQGNDKPDANVRGTALRAAHWLARQGPDLGGFPTAWPADAAVGDAVRIYRLDERDYRDCTLTLLLCYEVLQDPLFRRQAEKSADQLLKVRFSESKSARGLWHTAYELDGSWSRRLESFPRGVDVLASRYSMQTLLAMYLVLGNENCQMALDQAATSLSALPRQGGKWQRAYILERNEVRKPPTTAEAEPDEVDRFFATKPKPGDVLSPGMFGADGVLATLAQIKKIGRTNYQALLAEQLPYDRHFALTAAGLWDSPCSSDLSACGSAETGADVPSQCRAILRLLVEGRERRATTKAGG